MQDWVTKDWHDDWVASCSSTGQCACLFYLHQTSSLAIIPTGSADIFTIKHVWLWGHRTSKHAWNHAVLFCNSFTRLARLLHNTSLKFALKQQAYVLQLHSTTWHVGYNCTLTACMSVRVASHQQICLNQLQLTSKHIYSCGDWTSR